MINLYDIYGLLKNAVKYFPDDGIKCHRPNTFLVETRDEGANLTEATLGATVCDKDKDFFYSRLWEQKGYPSKIEFEWPLVSIYVRESNVQKLFGPKPDILPSVFLNVTDRYVGAECKNCSCKSCEGRGVNQIFADTEDILLTVISYLRDSAVYLIDGVETLYNKSHFEYLVEQGELERVDPLKSLDALWSVQNASALMYNTAPVKDVYGTSIRFNLELKGCNLPTFAFNSKVYTGNGCKDCG